MKPRFFPKCPFFVQDVLSSLRWQMMTPAERGCYMHLLFCQWAEGGLPAGTPELLRLGGLLDPPESHPLIVEAFPVCVDGLRRNGKMERVRSELEVFYSSQAEKATKGGLAKAAKDKAARGHASGQVSGMPQSAPPTPTPTPTELPVSTRSAPARDKPVRPTKPRKEPTGPAADCRRHWEAEWLRTRQAQWVWNARDASSVATLLQDETITPEEVCVRMTRILTTQDGWDSAHARPAMLLDRWNQFATDPKPNGKTHDGKHAYPFETAFEANQREMRELFGSPQGRTITVQANVPKIAERT